MLPSPRSMRSANGRAASAAACARRSLEAATICIALVIFCVALVEAMRTRMSLRLAIAWSWRCYRRALGERLREAVDHRLQFPGGGVRQVARLAHVFENVGVLGAHERQQPVLEGAHAVHRNGVEITVHAGVDHDDLLFHLSGENCDCFSSSV